MSDYRCFHSRSFEEQETTAIGPGTELVGVVACQHVFGIGVYVPTSDVWGHVDVTALGREHVPPDFSGHPAIGSHVRLKVLGRSANGQIKLAVT